MNTASIDTNGGSIEAFVVSDHHFPGIHITVNEETVAIVEYIAAERRFVVRTYSKGGDWDTVNAGSAGWVK